MFVLPAFAQSCGFFSETSATNALGYQTSVEGKSIIVALKTYPTGDSLLQKEQIAPADRPVFTNVDADTTKNPRGHFPDYVTGWSSSPTLSFQVKICDAFQTAIDPVNCLKDDTLEDYFGTSDKAEVNNAIMDALQLLTYSDMVPACYLESLKQTESFEKGITELDVDKARNRLKSALKSAIFSDCKDMSRASWGSHATCKSPNLNGVYQSLKRAIDTAASNDSKIREVYEKRFKLALRLGVDEFADFKESSDLYEINPFPTSIADYKKNFSCSSDSIGDDACLFGKKIISHLTADGDATKHIFVTVDKEFGQLLATQDFEGDARYAELFWAAVRLAKASNLKPKEVIARLEATNPESRAACSDVAAFKPGDQSKRFQYVLEPSRFENINSPVFTSNSTDAIRISQGENSASLPPPGTRFSLWMDSGADCVGDEACALEASQVGGEFSHARIRFHRPFSSPEEKMFPARPVSQGQVLLLSEAEIEELKAPEYNDAAIHIDLCLRSNDCENPAANSWVTIRSWRYENPFVKECSKGSESPYRAFYEALFRNRNISNNDCSALYNSVANLTELDLSDAGIANVVPLQNLISLRKLDLRKNKIQDVRVLEYLSKVDQVFLDGNPLSLEICPVESNNPALNSACLDRKPFVRLCMANNFEGTTGPAMQALHSLAGGSSCDEKFQNLRKKSAISLKAAGIVDLEPLRGLINLTSLDLSWNPISNVEPLRGLINLTSLGLRSNQISTVEPLRGLINLTSLDLNANRISNVEPLQGLINLRALDLFGNQISNVEPLRGLIHLTSLELSSNEISNVEPLRGLVNLESLDLKANLISDVEPLQGLINLTSLELSSNEISNVDSLRGLVNLESLDLSSNQIGNVGPLQGLINLKSLILSQNQISNVEPLRGLVNLESLDLGWNQISNVEPLKELMRAWNLYIHGNLIGNLSPLHSLSLDIFEASGNPVEKTASACPITARSEAINYFCMLYLQLP
jgi:internalin A